MADSDKNIKITPNISQTAQPNIVFTGQGNVPITLKVLDDSFGTLSFEASAGQLFSINNNLASGVIFAVNDVSGIPQIDVNADGTIRLAPFAAGVQVGGHTLGRGTGSVASNVVFGVSAFAACTTGASNTAIGQIALANLTTGNNNTGIGSWALGYITTTSGNISLGAEAGRLNVSGAALTGVTNSIYIGYLSIGNNSASNEIAIGTSAAGKGSNTTVIGNPSTTTTYLYGETSYIGGVAGTAISIQPQTRSTTGAGANVTIAAGAGVTTGAGGSVILQPGAQATSGGNGVVIVRQPGGTAGTDEIQLLHDGSKGSIINKDGALQLGGANIAIRNVANNANTTLTATTLYATGIYSSDSINADGVVSDSYNWAIDGSSLNWGQGFHIRVSWSHIKGYSSVGIAYTGNNTNGRYSTLEITNGSSDGGSLAYRSTNHTISANTNDLTPTRYSAVQRWSPTANYNVTGLAAGGSTNFSGGTPTSWIHTDGRVIWVHNVATAFNITLKHEDAGSTAANRFLTETGTDIILPPNSMVMLTYDGTSSRWRVHTLSSAVKVASSTNNISTATNDLALSYSNFQRLNCTTASNLTGAAPPSGGVHADGRMMRIYNVGTANLTLKHNSTSSTAANRFFCVQSADVVIATNDFAELIYDSTNNGSGAAGWRVA